MESQTLPCSLLIGQLLTWFCHRPDLTVDLAVNRRAMKQLNEANSLRIRHCVAGIIWLSLSKLTVQHWATQVCERKSPRAEVWVWVSQTSDISNMTERQTRQNEKGYYTLQRNFTKTGSSMKEEIWNCQIVSKIIRTGSSFLEVCPKKKLTHCWSLKIKTRWGLMVKKLWNQENYKCLWSCSLQLDDKCGSLLSFAAISFSMITLIFILASSIRLGKFPMIQLKQWDVFPPILWQQINVDLPSKRLSPSFSHRRCPLVGQVGQQWKITWCCTIAICNADMKKKYCGLILTQNLSREFQDFCLRFAWRERKEEKLPSFYSFP